MQRTRAPGERRGPLVLGINAAYHQSSAALVDASGVIAAAEEERFNRVKHGKSTTTESAYHLPLSSIDYCLRQAGCTIGEIDFIAYSFDPKKRAARVADIAEIGPVLGGGYETKGGDQRFLGLIGASPAILAGCYDVPCEKVEQRWVWVDHHFAHMASAFFTSPFENAAGLVVDGIGESAATTIAKCSGVSIEVLESVEFPHSLGFVWEVMTNFLGFEGNYDECKVMGLAAYGSPARYLDQLKQLLMPLADGTYRVDFARHADLLRGDYQHIERLLGGVRHRVPHEPVQYDGSAADHADVASALQGLTNEVMLRLAGRARALSGYSDLVMAGGVTLNAVANGAIARDTGVTDLWVQPAASDAGTSLGAALAVLHDERYGNVRKRLPMPDPYLGPEFDDSEVAAVLDWHRLQYRRATDSPSQAAYDLSRGLVVGWFQGRMEFGPRALGNRSLLADPRDHRTRERINRRVKHRQEFRPFAPSVLAEHVAEWFEGTHFPRAADFMLATWPVRPDKAELIPAVVHVDGSSRMQIVRQEANPLYHELISTFYRNTGIPMVLNTSFNDREPIVCSPEDAARCFLKTNIDVMYLGNYVVEGPKPWLRADRKHRLSDDILAIESLANE